MNYKNSKILVIDDDQEVRSLMSGVLSDEGYIVQQASNETDAIFQIKKISPDLIFLDLWIDQDESAGLKILEKIKQTGCDTPIVIISGHGTIDVAIQAVRTGAFDFMEKPFVIDRLLLTCERALETSKLRNEILSLKNEKLYSDVFSVGTSSFATSIKQTIEKLASSNSRVYINSGIGTFSESIAHKIHAGSSRSEKNFICINCISDDSENFENELFGTEKSYGYFEKASDGTIFLEEVDRLSKSAQRKLLMFLQNGRYICGNRIVYPDTRIICSSKINKVVDLIENEMFSDELFYRLKISQINVPDIKDRREDIIPITKYYVRKSDLFFGLQSKDFSHQAISILQSYDWPGNIYQIRNVVESALINSHKDKEQYINEACLPVELIANTKDKFEDLNVAKLISMPLREAKDCFESDYLRAQVQRFSGNISQTATFIGMERSALHRKLKNLNVQIRKENKNINEEKRYI